MNKTKMHTYFILFHNKYTIVSDATSSARALRDAPMGLRAILGVGVVGVLIAFFR